MAREEIKQVMAELGLTVEADFVPFSKSRHKDNKQRSLNWVVRLKKGTKTVIETDYNEGIVHCPSYSQSQSFGKMTVSGAEAILYECEKGRKHTLSNIGGAPISPDAESVVYSLVMESDAT